MPVPIAPGAPEECDGTDNDCDGQIDEDHDGDHDGASWCAGDCDDTDASSYIGAPELCDGIDNDCDDDVDEGYDMDADGWRVCDGDCDDEDERVYPGAEEQMEGMDLNCDGAPLRIDRPVAGCYLGAGAAGWPALLIWLVLLLGSVNGCRGQQRAQPPESTPTGFPTLEVLPRGEVCQVRWVEPTGSDTRNGRAVDATVEVLSAPGTEIVAVWARAHLSEQGATYEGQIQGLDDAGRWAASFSVPVDGEYSLCAYCMQGDGEVGSGCLCGWIIDNVKPDPPANLRRVW